MKIDVKKLGQEEIRQLHTQVSDAIFAESREQKEQFIKNNTSDWKETGSYYKAKRELIGFSKTDMAKKLGISSSTLTKFEEGKPTQLANIIQHGYENVFELTMKQKELDIHRWNLEKKEVGVIKAKEKWIDNPSTWTEEERFDFHDIIWTWITCNDNTYDLYKFLREIQDNDETAAFEYDESVAEFQVMFHKYLEQWCNGVDFYEKFYQKELVDYEKYKRQQALKQVSTH